MTKRNGIRSGILCPHCGGKTKRIRTTQPVATTSRRYQCMVCKERSTYLEIPDSVKARVIIRDLQKRLGFLPKAGSGVVSLPNAEA